jgi:hypothetical protein
MDSQRPKRHIKKPSRYSQSPLSVPLESQKPVIPDVPRPPKRPLLTIPVHPIPEDLAESLPFRQRSILSYIPLLGYIEYKAGSGVSEALDELFTFLLLLSEACVDRIMAATNSYAERDQNELHHNSPTKMDPNNLLRSFTLYWLPILYSDA